ncbi:hypothetical protein [Streptomyces flavofungini]|uniref:Uncharacterized protein n=1 Tax=Streptomyces flavofungini TaxID=68200 RepID=A0ABS0XIV8_9ACTN|nr:hypothetical protein [Streptomyces flavofungini]MBJ3813128.1 hypothetical protein [Streptomyces flavofungini]GHC89442.1 hypothetical protein GCM10010349_77250 [Streptomyces flavofungini]
MSIPTTDTPATELDLVTHSPDGESRGVFERTGSLFPLNPMGHILTAITDAPSPVRPWGLRFAEIARPSCGKHEGGSKTTTGDTPDGNAPHGEETQDD